MSASSIPSRVQGTSHATGSFSSRDSQIEFVRNAFTKGVFKPYETALDEPGDSGMATSWLTRIKELCINPAQNDETEKTLLFATLFIVAVDPKLKDTQKRGQMNLNLPTHYCDSFLSMPPVMSTNILRYCTKEIWDPTCEQLFKDPTITGEPRLFSWMKEAIASSWSAQEKQEFLDSLFECLPADKVDDLISHSLCHMPKDAAALLASCSEALKKRFTTFRDKIATFGRQLLTNPPSLTKPQYQPLDLPHTGGKRRYFLHWFKVEAHGHPNSDLIHTGFTEEDWQWLHDREKVPNLPATARASLLSITKRFTERTLVDDSLLNPDRSKWCSFYSSAVKCIGMHGEAATPLTSTSCRELATNLTAEQLFCYQEALGQDVLSNVIQQTIPSEAFVKFVKWIDLIIERSPHEKTAGRLLKLLDLITAYDLEKLIPHIYHAKQKISVAVTLFAAGRAPHQRAILEFILRDIQKSGTTLGSWISLCLDQEGDLSPFVLVSLIKNLFVPLNQIDHGFTLTLSTRLRTHFAGFQDKLDCLALILPVAVNMDDPVDRQALAFRKLIHHFKTRRISPEDRKGFVDSLRLDLQGSLTASEFAEQLHKKLPPGALPFIFLYFTDCLPQAPFAVSLPQAPPVITFQESTWWNTGANFLSALRDGILYGRSMPVPDASPATVAVQTTDTKNLDIWINLAAHTLRALYDKIDEVERGQRALAMLNLHTVATRTNTISQIEDRFKKMIAPKLNPDPTLEAFCRQFSGMKISETST